MKHTVVVVLALAFAGCDDKSGAPAAAVDSSISAPALAPSASAPAPLASAAPAPSATVAPTQIAAQHVLIAYRGAARAPAGVTRTKAEAKARAAEVDAKAKAGADFTALVAEYSDDPGAKERLGSVGKFSRDKMDKAFSDAAFALGVDQVSDVVETKFGFHVIKRNQ